MPIPGRPQDEVLRKECDRLMTDFMGMEWKEQLKVLRMTETWLKGKDAACELYDKIEREGIDAVSDNDMARLWVANCADPAKRPVARIMSFKQLEGLRIKRVEKKAREAREKAKEAERALKDVRATLKESEKLWEKEKSELLVRQESLEKELAGFRADRDQALREAQARA